MTWLCVYATWQGIMGASESKSEPLVRIYVRNLHPWRDETHSIEDEQIISRKRCMSSVRIFDEDVYASWHVALTADQGPWKRGNFSMCSTIINVNSLPRFRDHDSGTMYAWLLFHEFHEQTWCRRHVSNKHRHTMMPRNAAQGTTHHVIIAFRHLYDTPHK